MADTKTKTDKSFVFLPETRVYRVNVVVGYAGKTPDQGGPDTRRPLFEMHQTVGGLHEVPSKFAREYEALGGVTGEALASRMKHDPDDLIANTPSSHALKRWASRSDATPRAKDLIKAQLTEIARARAARGASVEE